MHRCASCGPRHLQTIQRGLPQKIICSLCGQLLTDHHLRLCGRLSINPAESSLTMLALSLHLTGDGPIRRTHFAEPEWLFDGLMENLQRSRRNRGRAASDLWTFRWRMLATS